MIIDLDALKPINDQHGHAAGDEVIIEVAKTLRQAIRPDDVLARWGGDEFVVVAHAQHVEHATMLAERIRERVAKMKCVLPRGAVVRTSCSIGLTCLPFVPGQPECRELGTRHQDRRSGAVPRQARPQRLARLVRHRIGGHAAVGHRRRRIQRRRPDRQRRHHRTFMSTRGSDDTVNALRVLREAR